MMQVSNGSMRSSSARDPRMRSIRGSWETIGGTSCNIVLLDILHAETDFAVLNIDDDHIHFIALFQNITDPADALFGDHRNMHQAIRARQDFDKGTKIH